MLYMFRPTEPYLDVFSDKDGFLGLMRELAYTERVVPERIGDLALTSKCINDGTPFYDADPAKHLDVEMEFHLPATDSADSVRFYLSLRRTHGQIASSAYCVKRGYEIELDPMLWAKCRMFDVEIDTDIMRNLLHMINRIIRRMMELAAFELAFPTLPNSWNPPSV